MRFALMLLGALAAAVVLAVQASGQTSACTDTATAANVVSKAQAAPAGAVLCLSGAYGSKTFSVSRLGTVTLRPADGVSASINPTVTGSGYTFDGLTLTGLYTNGARNTAFANSTFTGPARVDTPPSVPNAGIVFDHDTFDGINACGQCYEGRLSIIGTNSKYTQPVGVKVTNSHFGGGGASDGVYIAGDPYGVQVGPGNEFTGIKQGNLAAHVDPLQLYGSSHTVITGNYFHDNDTGIMAPNGGNAETVTNNVFVMSSYPYAIYFGWAQASTVVHNTFVGGSLHFEDWTNGTDHPSAHTSGTVSDNVLASGIDKIGVPAGALAQDYNLLPSGKSGANDLVGKPSFVGGGGMAGYQLASLSPGYLAADDGSSIGVNVTAGPLPTPTPTASPNPTASPSPTATASPTITPTPTPNESPTPSPTATATVSPTPEPYAPACAPTCDEQITALKSKIQRALTDLGD